jgi:hypothetical protein
MTNKEQIERNIGLTFDFVNYLMDNPKLIDKLPESFKLEFAEKDFPTIEKKNHSSIKSKSTKRIVRVRNTFEMTE